jgi:hypothetical protein
MGGPILAVAGALALYAYFGDGGASSSASSAGSAHYVSEICRAADDNGVGTDGAVIGVAVALTESGLRMHANRAVPTSLLYPHDDIGSDHDSVGLFQQRDNGAWGSVSDRMHAYRSADMFFSAMKSEYPNWDSMSPGRVAQGVQSSAYPSRYADHMSQARALVRHC